MPILEDGQLFERYRVHRWLGSGIAGESYEAEDRILQRKVTLKLIHPWATLSDSARRQFFREMQGISLLNHPYLATVLDYGETDGRIYVARRYVSSGSLLSTNGRLWFRPPLPVTNAFKYAHQLAQALQYIHQHGYLHGSLTFANVLVLRGPNAESDTDYAPFLMADIGLANFVRRFGNPRIETLPVSAAPEQLSKRVTPASDQFALAVLVYFWLAGRPPYLGTSSEIEHQKLSETITPLSVLNPGITLEQDSIILRALKVLPEDRHSSVLAFAENLLASLTSVIRQYAVSPNTLAPQPETPRELLHTSQSEEPVVDEVDAQATLVERVQATGTTSAEEEPAPASATQLKAEPQRSALEELLAIPQTEPTNLASEEEVDNMPDEEEAEIVQEEEIILFPTLPETPQVEESILPLEYTHIVSDEATEPLASKQTGPLAAEPAEEISEFEEEMSVDQPDSEDLTQPGELSTPIEETTSTIQPGEALPTREEARITAPLQALASTDAESEPLQLDESSAASEEATLSLADNELLIVSEENAPVHSIDEPLPLSEKDTPEKSQDETLLANEEARVLDTLANELPTDSAVSSSEPLLEETEVFLEPHSSLPIQETHETTNEIYSPIEEVIVAPRLIISSPYTSSSYEFLLTNEETHIGRAGASDLYLEQDNLTSRHHALLRRIGERALIFDKHSNNGVFINGQKIDVGRGYELADGDHIGIGNYELIFRSASANHISQLI